MPKLLQGVRGGEESRNFLCIIKSRAFPDWLQHPALRNRAENTKADQVESRESGGRHVSPVDERRGVVQPHPGSPPARLPLLSWA